MKTVLFMAISADGFIARPNDETPWSDASWKDFEEFVMSCDVVLLGRRTFEIMAEQHEFVMGPEYVVVTRNNFLDVGGLRKISIDHKDDLPSAGKLGIIGGGELNGGLAKLDVIDEIILDVEPIVLGRGKRLFGDNLNDRELLLIGSRVIGGSTVRNRYEVRRRLA